MNIKDIMGNTPLLTAAKRCSSSGISAMRKLCEAKCDLDATDYERKTALHYCCHKAVGVELLLSYGANPNIQDADGNAPMHLAAIEGFDRVIETLLEYDADPNLANCWKKLPIHYLAMKNHFEGISDIAVAHGDVDALDEKGNAPLWYAVDHNRVDAVKALLKANCITDPLTGKDGNFIGNSPLKTALDKDYFGLAKLLVLAGCNLLPLYDWIHKMEALEAEREAEIAEHQRIFGVPPDETETNASQVKQKMESEKAMQWFEDWIHCPHSLQQLCRIYIRRHMGHGIRSCHGELPLPLALVDYVTLKEVEDHHIEGFGFSF